jgi:hypothetical protein
VGGFLIGAAMSLGNLSIKVSADIGQFTTNLDLAGKAAQASMSDSSAAVSDYRQEMAKAGQDTSLAAAKMSSSMKAANDAIMNGSVEAVNSIQNIADTADQTDFRPMGERIAEAIGTGIGVGIAGANKAWDGFVAYSKTKTLVIGAAMTVAATAVGLGAVYAAYKVISGSMDFIVGLITGDSYKNANIDALIEANDQVKAIQRSLGSTAQQAAATNEALKALGVDKSDYLSVYARAEDAIHGNKDALDQLGVSYGSVQELMQSANTVLNTYAEGWDRNQVAQQLGLGTAAQVADAAKVTSAALSQGKSTLDEYNLGIGVETQEASKRFADTTREFNHNLDLTSQGFKRAIADQIMPILTDLADFFKDGFPFAVNVFRYSMATITSLFYGLKTSAFIVLESIVGGLSAVTSTLVGVVSAGVKAVSGDFTGAKNDLIKGWEEGRNRLDDIGKNIVAQAQGNSAAMRMAWAFDDRDVADKAKGGKTFVDPAIAKKIKDQEDAYKKMADAITEKTGVQQLEIQLNEKLTEGQRKAVEFTNALAAGTLDLTDAQKQDYTAKLEALIAQEKINKAMQDARNERTKDNGYDSLIKSIREKIDIQKLEQTSDDSLTEGQKLASKVNTDLQNGVLKLTAGEKARVTALLDQLVVEEQLNAAHKDALKLAADMEKASTDNLKSLDSQIDAERIRNAEMGLSKEQIEELASKRLLDSAAADEELASNMRLAADYAGPLHDAYIQYANDLDNAAIKKRALSEIRSDNADKQKGIDALAEATKARDELDKLFDPAKGRDFGNTIKGALGEAVGAVVKLDAAMRTYGTNQAALEKSIALAKTEANGDSEVLAQRMDQINRKSAENQLANYAQITGAAKGFFNESSRGYKALQAAEQIFQAVQLALTLSTTAAKLFGVSSVTAATVAGEEAKTAAVTAGLGVQLAADQAKGASAAAVAVATQAEGDPYSAWGRMAAMAAAMAAIGFTVGGFGADGGGGGKTAAQMQQEQGTGTVFGDAMAKSDSITKSMDILKNNSDLMLPINQGMLASLRVIQSSMSGLANLIVRTAGVTDGGNFGIQTGTISQGSKLGDFANSIPNWLSAISGGFLGFVGTKVLGLLGSLWGKTTQNIVDSGFQFGGKLTDLQKGVGYNQYASVDTTSSSWFGLKKDTSNSIVTQGLNQEISNQFGLIFTNLETALKGAAKGLGVDVNTVTDILSNLKIDNTSVSLKGLTGQALTDAINSVVSKAMDQMSSAVFPAMEAFRAVGEGYTQTVIRVASGVEVAQNALDKFGIKAIQFSDVINKQGDIGAEIIRQSISGVEGLSGVGKIIDGMTGSASDLTAAYQTLLDLRKQMAGVGLNGQNLGTSIIDGAGGTKGLADGLSAYQDQYFTDAEKAAAMTKNLAAEFAKLGVAMPSSKAELRALIEQTGTGTDASAKLTGQLLALTSSFATASDAVQKLSDAQRQAVQAASDSYASFADGLRKFQSSLMLSSASTLTPIEKYAEAKRQYEATLTKAKAGDKDAQSQYQSVANAFLDASRAVNASSTAYASDFQNVMGNAGEMAKWADQQVDLAKASLTAMNQQVAATGQVVDAVNKLGDRMMHHMGGTAPGGDVLENIGGVASQQIDYSKYGQENTTALVDEIKQLRAEVKNLRDDQQQQTDQIVAANYDANYGAAKTVVDSTAKAAKDTIWAQQSIAVIKR